MARLTKRGRRILIGGAVVVTTLGIGLWAWRAQAKPKKVKKPSPKQAVSKALRQLGSSASKFELTDFAYILAYPKCPSKLDPNNPDHEECIEKWLGLMEEVEVQKAALPPPTRGSKKKTKTSESDEPAKKAGALSGDLLRWWSSLSSGQRAKVKEVLGSGRINQIVEAANTGNDVILQARINNLRSYAEVNVTGLQQLDLAATLGESKIKELRRIVGI